MSTITTYPVARRQYLCDTGDPYCAGIKRGARYRCAKLPPNDNDVGNEGWWTHRECEECSTAERRWTPPEEAPHA